MEGNIQFKDPYEMLTVIDDDILEGNISLHDWQREILQDYGKPSDAAKPFKAAVRAANGSGKEQFVIAPCALWTCMSSANAVAIVTTASGNQLDRQTDKYINQ